MARAFIKNIQNVIPTETPDTYMYFIEIAVYGTDLVTGAVIQFEAPWGADWRNMARSAILAWAADPASNVNQSIDGVVFNDLSYV